MAGQCRRRSAEAPRLWATDRPLRAPPAPRALRDTHLRRFSRRIRFLRHFGRICGQKGPISARSVRSSRGRTRPVIRRRDSDSADRSGRRRAARRSQAVVAPAPRHLRAVPHLFSSAGGGGGVGGEEKRWYRGPGPARVPSSLKRAPAPAPRASETRNFHRLPAAGRARGPSLQAPSIAPVAPARRLRAYPNRSHAGARKGRSACASAIESAPKPKHTAHCWGDSGCV